MKGYEPQRVAHFLNRIIFCMFAEDVGLLPNPIFSKLAAASVAHPETFETNAKQLFGGMAKGGAVAFEVIDWFNGGLFDDDATLPLDSAELKLVLQCAELDWSNIEPSIFGTLFERGLDPDKRSQQGAHYTDPATIMKIVRPVVLDPWEREWEIEKAAIEKLTDRAKKAVSDAAKQRLYAFLERLANFKVLDPACGSGNFLYLALRGLKGFEKRVILEPETLGLPIQFPRVGPDSVLGIEVNAYAAELARVTIWIGELQWMLENGFQGAKNPILKTLDQVVCRDAILNEDGSEAEWPQADVVVGNPPFLGGSKLRRLLGDEYTERLWRCYKGRVPGAADLVCYWFEKARSAKVSGCANRVGFVATQGIRNGASRTVLDKIIATESIFDAWSDEPWINEGAAVRVSLICFARKDLAPSAVLDGVDVGGIDSNLTSSGAYRLSDAVTLTENSGVCFMGSSKKGAFEINGETARKWLKLPNPHGKPNSDVVRPWRNGWDITHRHRDMWIVDFGTLMSERDAALYEEPFRYISAEVRPIREKNNREAYRKYWWRHAEPRPGMRAALKGLTRYIATPEVSKYRLFVWLPASVLPDQKLYAITRADDATFGVLSSRIHEVWALAQGSMHGVGNDPRYTVTTTFETFPFPSGMAPGATSTTARNDDKYLKIEAAAKRLNDLREHWLNPPEFADCIKDVVPGLPDIFVPKSPETEQALSKRTLTNLYNLMPAWLKDAHRELDEAVAAAYGWEWPLPDCAVLKRLFDLNQQRTRPLDFRPQEKTTLKARKAAREKG